MFSDVLLDGVNDSCLHWQPF